MESSSSTGRTDFGIQQKGRKDDPCRERKALRQSWNQASRDLRASTPLPTPPIDAKHRTTRAIRCQVFLAKVRSCADWHFGFSDSSRLALTGTLRASW